MSVSFHFNLSSSLSLFSSFFSFHLVFSSLIFLLPLACCVTCVVYVCCVGCAVWCPCVHSKRPRVHWQHVRMFKTMRTCCAGTHGDVFECTHGGLLNSSKRLDFVKGHARRVITHTRRSPKITSKPYTFEVWERRLRTTRARFPKSSALNV